MQSNSINILYWVLTILFAALMIFASYGSILVNEDAKKLIHDQLGFPVYFIPFTGYAKLIGSIAILIPGLKTIKEWAYAGLFFDLVGAVYSGIEAAKVFDPMILFFVSMVYSGNSVLYFLEEKNEIGYDVAEIDFL